MIFVPFGFLLLIPVVFDLVSRPTFRRLAFRSISRRRGEAALVIIGALLGTAIITASLVVGDTVEGAIRDAARTDLGPIDESIRVTDAAKVAAVLKAVTNPAISGIDGTLRLDSAAAVVANKTTDRKAVPVAGMIEVDFDEARNFGSDSGITGLAEAGATPTGDEVVIGHRLARKIEVGPGDPIEIFADGTSKSFKVRQVVEDQGLVGYVPRSGGQGQGGSRPLGVFVAKGTIESFAKSATGASATPSNHEVLISNTGGIFDGAGTSATISDALVASTKGIQGVQVVKAKADLLDGAKAAGENFSTLFSGIGYFSVIAGILLLVNLFVMLSEERKSELGMLRALGFKRNHLVRSFAIEGSVYSVIASVLGAFAAVGVGWVIILAAANIISRGDADLTFPLVVKPASLLIGGLTGLAISMFTVWGTSARIARLNIICAIRDLPDPKKTRRGYLGSIFAGLGVAIGLLVFRGGWANSNGMGILAGPAIAFFCLVPLLDRLLPRKLVTVVCSASVLAWGIAAFTVASDKMGRAGINVFVIQGIVLVAAGVVLFSQADRLWALVAKGLSATGRGLAARLGLAYPHAGVSWLSA